MTAGTFQDVFVRYGRSGVEESSPVSAADGSCSVAIARWCCRSEHERRFSWVRFEGGGRGRVCEGRRGRGEGSCRVVTTCTADDRILQCSLARSGEDVTAKHIPLSSRFVDRASHPTEQPSSLHPTTVVSSQSQSSYPSYPHVLLPLNWRRRSSEEEHQFRCRVGRGVLILIQRLMSVRHQSSRRRSLRTEDYRIRGRRCVRKGGVDVWTIVRGSGDGVGVVELLIGHEGGMRYRFGDGLRKMMRMERRWRAGGRWRTKHCRSRRRAMMRQSGESGRGVDEGRKVGIRRRQWGMLRSSVTEMILRTCSIDGRRC